MEGLSDGRAHAFAGNPILFGKRDNLSTEELKDLIFGAPDPPFQLKILLMFDGKPLIAAAVSAQDSASWSLAWQSLLQVHQVLLSLKPLKERSNDEVLVSEAAASTTSADDFENYERLVYIGERDRFGYFALDISASGLASSDAINGAGKAREIAEKFEIATTRLAFTDLRTLMLGTDWTDEVAMGELSIAGHARAMVQWHSQARYCGHCGARTLSIMAGQRRQCSNSFCKHKWYPRIDPVVIMLVINKDNDSALFSRQSHFPRRMWSCLAGFIEPGESLEEAVRRETREETSIEIGQILYHSSQPWPVGPTSMSCQLMVGFFAFAKTLDIHVDGKELEEAQWQTREQVCHTLRQMDYKHEQELAAVKVYKSTVGGDKERGTSSTSPLQATEGVTMFLPGPYAIAHHLISTWANNGAEVLLSKF
ncbi:hypothetical protein O6H91_09G069600 [Diphasiastrum complanatum]|uniref:Uncharacterized protein n=1 Tax=Diphasiastrum complanatum TaxID=34168 RepID=A0ACC2CQJ1_DIPCM|nr:hypothetical protein O6H91_09G069600 [Diphasiastrum complanatum]